MKNRPSPRFPRWLTALALLASAACAQTTSAATLRRRKRLKFLFICELIRRGKGRQDS